MLGTVADRMGLCNDGTDRKVPSKLARRAHLFLVAGESS